MSYSNETGIKKLLTLLKGYIDKMFNKVNLGVQLTNENLLNLDEGYYWADHNNSCEQKPNNVTAFALHVVKTGVNNKHLELISGAHKAAVSNSDIYYRDLNEGEWGSWTKAPLSADKLVYKSGFDSQSISGEVIVDGNISGKSAEIEGDIEAGNLYLTKGKLGFTGGTPTLESNVALRVNPGGQGVLVQQGDVYLPNVLKIKGTSDNLLAPNAELSATGFKAEQGKAEQVFTRDGKYITLGKDLNIADVVKAETPESENYYIFDEYSTYEVKGRQLIYNGKTIISNYIDWNNGTWTVHNNALYLYDSGARDVTFGVVITNYLFVRVDETGLGLNTGTMKDTVLVNLGDGTYLMGGKVVGGSVVLSFPIYTHLYGIYYSTKGLVDGIYRKVYGKDILEHLFIPTASIKEIPDPLTLTEIWLKDRDGNIAGHIDVADDESSKQIQFISDQYVTHNGIPETASDQGFEFKTGKIDSNNEDCSLLKIGRNEFKWSRIIKDSVKSSIYTETDGNDLLLSFSRFKAFLTSTFLVDSKKDIELEANHDIKNIIREKGGKGRQVSINLLGNKDSGDYDFEGKIDLIASRLKLYGCTDGEELLSIEENGNLKLRKDNEANITLSSLKSESDIPIDINNTSRISSFVKLVGNDIVTKFSNTNKIRFLSRDTNIITMDYVNNVTISGVDIVKNKAIIFKDTPLNTIMTLNLEDIYYLYDNLLLGLEFTIILLKRDNIQDGIPKLFIKDVDGTLVDYTYINPENTNTILTSFEFSNKNYQEVSLFFAPLGNTGSPQILIRYN